MSSINGKGREKYRLRITIESPVNACNRAEAEATERAARAMIEEKREEIESDAEVSVLVYLYNDDIRDATTEALRENEEPRARYEA